MYKKFYELEKLGVFSKNEFLIYRKSEHYDEIYTYEEMIKVCHELSDFFSNFGLRNTRLTIQSPHCPGLCVILLSLLNCECSFCPVSHNARDNEVLEAMEKFDSPFLITDCAKKHVHLEILGSKVILNNEFYICKILSKQTDIPLLKLPDECYCIKTSGSTGAAKIVHVPYKCIEPNITSLSTLLEISSRDLIWMLSPITFDPFVVEFFLALKNGCSILITKYSIPNVEAEILQPKHLRGPSVVQMTPSVFRLFGLKNIQNKVLHENTSIRTLLLGGERFPSAKEFSNWTVKNNNKTRVFNIYGITEVSCWSTSYEAKTTDEEDFPIGLPLDVETQVRLVNDSSEPIEEGLGFIEIGSRTRKCAVDNEIRSDINSNEILFRSTGDIGLIRGGKIYYRGRKNEMVKRYGNRVQLNEVESKISEIDGVLGVCCIFKEESMILVCFIIKEKDSIKKKIQQNILTKLMPAEKPDKIEFVNSFPLTSHGKISKSNLLKMPADLAGLSAKRIFERFIVDILCLDLNQSKSTEMPAPSKIRKKSLDLSFLDAGGTSFQALTLFTQSEQILNRPAPKLLEFMLNGTTSLSFILEYIDTLNNNFYSEGNVCEEKKENELEELLNFKWKYDTGKCVDASPSCCGNIVCVGSHSHRLITLNCKSGEEVSTCILPDRIECQATFVNENQILVGCYDGFLYAIDCLSGQIQRKFNCEGMIKSRPLVQNGNVVVIGSYSKQFNLRCFDLNKEQVVWRASIGSRGIFSSPLQINTESFLVCSLDGYAAKVNFSTGNIIWRAKFPSPVFSTPALYAETHVLIAEVSGVLHCLDLKCANEVWNLKMDGNIFSSIVTHRKADKNYIVFGNHDCKVYCLMSDQPNKQPHTCWKNTLNSAVYSTPVVFNLSPENLAVLSCSTKGSIYIFDFSEGSTLFTLDLENEVYSSPCIHENRIYIGCRNNDLICLEIQSKVK